MRTHLVYLREQAQHNLQQHIHENSSRRIPEVHDRNKPGVKDGLVVNKSLDDKTKLQALALINDCNKYKMDLTTNGSLVMDSVKIVESRLNHLNGHGKKAIAGYQTKE